VGPGHGADDDRAAVAAVAAVRPAARHVLLPAEAAAAAAAVAALHEQSYPIDKHERSQPSPSAARCPFPKNARPAKAAPSSYIKWKPGGSRRAAGRGKQPCLPAAEQASMAACRYGQGPPLQDRPFRPAQEVEPVDGDNRPPTAPAAAAPARGWAAAAAYGAML